MAAALGAGAGGGARTAPVRRRPEPATGRDRCLDAAAVCIARTGVRKTSLDDVAAEAGCARATLYRHFPGKRALLEALVTRETERLVAALRTAADGASDLDAAALAVTVCGARALRASAPLQRVLELEPERIQPYLAFDPASDLLVAMGRALAPCFTRFVEPDAARRLGEWLVRLVLPSIAAAVADDDFDPTDPTSARALVSGFVIPGFLATMREGIPA